MNWTSWMGLGGLSGALCVMIGAFGAHALKERLDERAMQIFEIGAKYHMYHALALLILAFIATKTEHLLVQSSGLCFFLGTVLFSGSLYALALGGPRWLGMVTPIGGLSFIAGWLSLAALAWKLS